MLEAYPLSRLEDLGLVTSQNPRLVVPQLGEAEDNRNTSDVDVDQQLLGEFTRGHNFPNVPPPEIPLSDVSRAEVRSDGSIVEE
jgi:hypothetical protein